MNPQWQTVVAPIQQSLWTINTGSWAAILSNVTQVEISIELITNGFTPSPSNPGDHDGIDNVILASAVPEPASLVMAATAALTGAGYASRKWRRWSRPSVSAQSLPRAGS